MSRIPTTIESSLAQKAAEENRNNMAAITEIPGIKSMTLTDRTH